MEIYLIRHGQSQSNINNHLIGGRSPGSKLSEEGRLQGKKLGEFFKENVNPTIIYSSSLVRAVDTALIFKENLDKNIDIELIHELAELSQGEWEGKARSQIYTDKQLNIINSSSGWFTPPGGESQIMAQLRAIPWLVNCIHNKWKSEEVVVIIAHGTLINNLVQFILNFDRSFTHKLEIDNCGYHYLQFDKKTSAFTKVRLCQNKIS